MQTAGSFATDLLYVPAETRVRETFGFTPAAFALGAALAAVGGVVDVLDRGWLGPEQLAIPAVAGLAVLLFGFWELRRRARRTSLVRVSTQLGVYRGDRLAQVVSRPQIGIYKLSVVNTLRELVATATFALMALGAAGVVIASTPGAGLMLLGAGVGFAGAFVSALWARVACRHFFVPNGARMEQVMLARADASRVGL